jgi:alpha-tubulin suppressor-like RCC1 family protein
MGGDMNTGLPEHDDEIIRQLNQMTQEIINEDKASSMFLLQPKEKVEQVECGSIHTMVRTNLNRLFSCGNGSTYALGHGNRETCRTFKQIKFFNGSDNNPTLQGVSIKVIACGMMHSGCVLNDGTVYQWGTCGDYQSINQDTRNAKELLSKAICQYPAKVLFRNCVEVNV